VCTGGTASAADKVNYTVGTTVTSYVPSATLGSGMVARFDVDNAANADADCCGSAAWAPASVRGCGCGVLVFVRGVVRCVECVACGLP